MTPGVCGWWGVAGVAGEAEGGVDLEAQGDVPLTEGLATVLAWDLICRPAGMLWQHTLAA
jgi:hypothetical protein